MSTVPSDPSLRNIPVASLCNVVVGRLHRLLAQYPKDLETTVASPPKNKTIYYYAVLFMKRSRLCEIVKGYPLEPLLVTYRLVEYRYRTVCAYAV
jgi:hypothetical protein